MQTPTVLNSLPCAVYGKHALRTSDEDMLQFEAVLDAANDAVVACEAARHDAAAAAQAAEIAALQSENGTGEEAKHKLAAIVRAVSSVTDSQAPGETASRAELTAWAIKSILLIKDASPKYTRKASGMNEEAVEECLKLVCALNRKLDADAH